MDSFSNVEKAMMQRALTLATIAATQGEVPVGAVLHTSKGDIIGEGYNHTIQNHDITAHAEIIALRQAGQHLNNYRLPTLSLTVTLEPCAMCMSAILQARIEKLNFAIADSKTGACGSVINLCAIAQLNHHTTVHQGLYKEQSAHLLQTFFRQRRYVARKKIH